MVEMIGEWIELQRSKGIEISVATVGALYDFGYWLKTQAAQQTPPPPPDRGTDIEIRHAACIHSRKFRLPSHNLYCPDCDDYC